MLRPDRLFRLFARQLMGQRFAHRKRKQIHCAAHRRIDSLEPRLVLTTPYAQFGFGVIASNLDFSENTFFGSSDPTDRPYSEINFGQVEFYALSGFDIVGAGISNVSDLEIGFGSMNSSDPPVLTLESFDDGLGDGIANQVFTAGNGDDNSIVLLNNGTPVAEGVITRLEVETTPAFVSTAFGSITFTAAVGGDTSVFDEIMSVTSDTGNFNFETGEFDTDGTIVFGTDGSLFLSNGVGVYGEVADLESLDFIPIDLDAGGDLNVRPTSAAQGDLTLRVDANGHVVLSDSNGVLDDQFLDYGVVTGGLEVNGTDGDDTFSLDFTNGSPIPANGLTFDGKGQTGMGQGDTLELSGGSATRIVHQFLNASDGSIDVDGAMIAYEGLEPIIDNIDAANRVFTFGNGGNLITLSDDDTPDNGISRIASSAASETVDFANPSNSLTINSGHGSDTVLLNAVDSLFTATTVVNALGGNDTVDGSALTTMLVATGHGGNDVLIGGSGNDTLRGGAGRDTIDGGAGNDSLYGQGSTGDRLTGGRGNDLIDGGAGTDFLVEFTDRNVTLSDTRYVALNGAFLGVDTLDSIERAIITGNNNDNKIDARGFSGRTRLIGRGGADRLFGGSDQDVLIGGAGTDILRGNDGNDRLLGGGGSGDVLTGGAGSDTLNGGVGADRINTDGMDTIIMDAMDTIVGP